MAKQENGKGGSFETRANPFLRLVSSTTMRPEVASAPMLLLAVDRLIGAGCALIIGSTRDGGALCLTILDDQDRHRTYCSNEQELDAAVASILDMYAPT
jgi:hypothetical protein